MIREAWYAAGWSDEFTIDVPEERVIAGRPIVVWRTARGARAFENRCAHKRFPLSEGTVVDGRLQCAYHGFRYDDTGACVHIPALGSGRIPQRAAVEPYPVVERDGVVWIWPGHSPAPAGPSATPVLGDRHSASFVGPTEVIGAAPLLMIENLVDLTHFFPLHAGSIGNPENNAIPVEVEREADAVIVRRTVADYATPPVYADWFALRGERCDREQVIRVHGPGMVTVTVRVGPVGGLGGPEERLVCFFHLLTPGRSASDHVWRWACAGPAAQRSSDPELPCAVAVGRTTLKIVEEDRWAVEQQQRMMDFPDDGYREVAIKTDAGVLAVRAFLDEQQAV